VGAANEQVFRKPMMYREPTMKKSSERLVVFVTPAQKRAISTSAQAMGISVSELLRRAVLAYDATGEQVRAARILDSMRVPQPDALNETLRRVAQALPTVRRGVAPVASGGRSATSTVQPDETGEQPVPVAATVARALEEQALSELPPGTVRKIEGEGSETGLDEQAVARIIASKSEPDLKQNSPAADDGAEPQAPAHARTRRSRTERGDEAAESDAAQAAKKRFA
jgi:hypothetical protein